MPYGDAVEPAMAMLSFSDLALSESLYALTEIEKAKEEVGIDVFKYLIVFIFTITKNIKTVPTCFLSFVTSCLPWLYDIPSFVMNT